ncbi:MAG: hypothetical protein WCT20_04770 [Candidatus Babeliales bacterium]
MAHWLIRLALLVLFFTHSSMARTSLPSIDRLHRSIDNKTTTSDGTVDFKDAITVISGNGFVRTKDGTMISKPSINHNLPLFWATQTTLAQTLKEQAATSKEAALKELRNALFAHYLNDATPLLTFARDLEAEGLWLASHTTESDNAILTETWQTLVVTVNNLLLW